MITLSVVLIGVCFIISFSETERWNYSLFAPWWGAGEINYKLRPKSKWHTEDSSIFPAKRMSKWKVKQKFILFLLFGRVGRERVQKQWTNCVTWVGGRPGNQVASWVIIDEETWMRVDGLADCITATGETKKGATRKTERREEAASVSWVNEATLQGDYFEWLIVSRSFTLVPSECDFVSCNGKKRQTQTSERKSSENLK